MVRRQVEGVPPIVSVVGRSKSGKTSLIERLVAELKLRGYHVATIKHAQEINLDKPGKDSWRHIRAGSEATAVVSASEAMLIKPVTPAVTLDEITRLLGDDYDIILTEGFKKANVPKVEVRYGGDGAPLKGIKKLIAVVSNKPVETKVRQFSITDTKGLVDLLEKGFIEPRTERLALYINGKRITLKSFPRKIISSLLINMVSSLKGVSEVSSLDIFIRKPPRQG